MKGTGTPSGREVVLGGLLMCMLSCGGEDAASPPTRPTTPTALTPASVTLAPAEVTVVAGDTIRVRATVLNDRGRPISDASVTWTSSTPAVATVDATGLVTGVKWGKASLTATAGPATTTAPVTVQSRDRPALIDLYDSASGADWTNNRNWTLGEPIGSWYGVEVNAESRVTALDLSGNGLKGQLPESLGSLAFLTELRIDGNEQLSGSIPLSLSKLGIRTFHYGGTSLCTLRDEGFRAWLNAIPTHEGDFIACNEERSDLMKLYEAMGGERWRNSRNWGTDAPLGDWVGIATDPKTGRVAGINLSRNGLRGRIPPEIQYLEHLEFLRLDHNQLEGEIPPYIGNLSELKRLDLDGNEFSGRIPPEIGNLVKLEVLWLGGDRLTGPIPPELGNLRRLEALHLYRARFEGSIPEEFGRLRALRVLEISNAPVDGPLPESLAALRNLQELHIFNTRLSGPLPAALGEMRSLRHLVLVGNEIDGPLPAEFGGAGQLYSVWLQNNPDLSGPLPESMTWLEDLFDLRADGTALCLPRTPVFRSWLKSVYFKYRIRSCGGEAHAEAYLTQAAQSREFPVPLVAGEEALLRVFVMSEQDTGATIPPVRATLFLYGEEVRVENIPAGSSLVPVEVEEGELDLSANARIPGEVIQPGLEMVVEVDPDGTLDPNLGVSKRIPENGRMAVDVRVVPPLQLTLIPFVSTADDDEAAAEFVSGADPDDEIFWQTRNLLPVGAFGITRHEPVTVDTNDIERLLRDVGRIRQMEEGIGHWMGLIPNPEGGTGIAHLPFFTGFRAYRGKTSVSRLDAETIAHELGHNLSLRHADCGGASSVDPSFPYESGQTGIWGYDPREGGSLVPPDRADLMSYCDPTWISDYFFQNALRFRLQDPLEVWEVPAATRTLLVSGGAAADGELHLDPVFVVEAPPDLPHAAGPYTLTGARADGSELFSVSFDMAEIWDGQGGFGFNFALPAQDAWEAELESLVLSGPGGAVEIREGSTAPMAIMRDPVTGQVRAIFRNLPSGPLARGAADAQAPEPGLDILVSSGLPGAEAWRR